MRLQRVLRGRLEDVTDEEIETGRYTIFGDSTTNSLVRNPHDKLPECVCGERAMSGASNGAINAAADEVGPVAKALGDPTQAFSQHQLRDALHKLAIGLLVSLQATIKGPHSNSAMVSSSVAAYGGRNDALAGRLPHFELHSSETAEVISYCDTLSSLAQRHPRLQSDPGPQRQPRMHRSVGYRYRILVVCTNIPLSYKYIFHRVIFGQQWKKPGRLSRTTVVVSVFSVFSFLLLPWFVCCALCQ